MSRQNQGTPLRSLIMLTILILAASCSEDSFAKAKGRKISRRPAALIECGFQKVSKEAKQKHGNVNVEIYSLYSPNPLHVLSASAEEVIAKKKLFLEPAAFNKIKANKNSLPYYIKLRDRDSGKALAQSGACSVKN